jgi:hypothetical protein
MLDSAVVWFGITIENALLERVKVGFGPNVEYKPKYTLARLLDSRTKLPRPPETYKRDEEINVWAPLLAWAGKRNSGVRRWVYVPPPAENAENSEVTDG